MGNEVHRRRPNSVRYNYDRPVDMAVEAGDGDRVVELDGREGDSRPVHTTPAATAADLLGSVNPNDVRYGNGQFVSDVVPGTRRWAQLSMCFLGQPFHERRFTHFVENNVDGLSVVEGRDGVFVIPGEIPLDLMGRIVSWGPN